MIKITHDSGCVRAHFSYGSKMEVSIINKKVIPNNVNDDLVNEKIRFKEVMVIDKDGTKLGIKLRREALDIAYDQELDLLCVAPNATPPVCKVLDYGRYRFEQQKKAKEAKKKQKITEVKEVRLSPNIDTNDLNTKTNAARKFLEKGDKVKVTLRFRGREMAHMAKSKYILDDFAEVLSDIAVVDKPSKVEGRSMVMFLTAKR